MKKSFVSGSVYLQLSMTNEQCWVSIGKRRKFMAHWAVRVILTNNNKVTATSCLWHTSKYDVISRYIVFTSYITSFRGWREGKFGDPKKIHRYIEGLEMSKGELGDLQNFQQCWFYHFTFVYLHEKEVVYELRVFKFSQSGTHFEFAYANVW